MQLSRLFDAASQSRHPDEDDAPGATPGVAARLARVFQAVADGIVLVEPDGRIGLVNAAAERLLGSAAAELLGTDAAAIPIAITGPGGEPLAEDAFPATSVLRTGEPVMGVERQVRQPSGQRVRLLIDAAPLLDEAGGLDGVVCTLHDARAHALDRAAQAQEMAREALAEADSARRQLAFLAEASNVLAASLDYETILQSIARIVVPYLADWCSVNLVEDDGSLARLAVAHVDPAREAVLHELREHYLPDLRGGHPLARAIRDGRPMIFPKIDAAFLRQIVADARQLELELALGTHAVMVAPLLARGHTIGAITFGAVDSARRFGEANLRLAEDLAHRAALAVDNARLYRRAQRVVREREEFLSIASHELKTPLTTVKGYLQLLTRQIHREDSSPERLLRVTNDLQAQAARLEELVSDLLDVSRVHQGRLDLRPARLDLAALAREVLARFEHAQERKPSHTLVVDAPEPVEGWWDPSRLDQVLTNLISNALKYSPDGGEVRVRVRRQDDEVEIRVSDQGIGISPADQATLFQPFTRGQAVRLGLVGTGLGLYISARIVEHHGGSIEVRSRPGAGSTFIARLPRREPGGPAPRG